MKPSINTDFLLKTTAFLFVAVTFFFFGKHWSQSDGYHQLIFFSSSSSLLSSPQISISPNFNHSLNDSTLIDHIKTLQPTPSPPQQTPLPPPPPSPPPQSPPPDPAKKFGIVNDEGTMSEEFEIGEFDPETVGDDGVNETPIQDSANLPRDTKFAIKRFGFCPRGMSEYIPCLDNAEAIRNLESTEKGERFERHCPSQGNGLNCLVPPPKGYRPPIPWPKSRDEVLLLFHC